MISQYFIGCNDEAISILWTFPFEFYYVPFNLIQEYILETLLVLIKCSWSWTKMRRLNKLSILLSLYCEDQPILRTCVKDSKRRISLESEI